MSTPTSPLAYTPADPIPGKYLAKIIQVKQDTQYIYVSYDIAVGPSAGWAHTKYLLTGRWLLQMRFPINCDSPSPTSLCRVAGVTEPRNLIGCLVCVELAYADGSTNPPYYRLRRSYPASHYIITPDDIKVGTSNWATGSPDTTRATYIAQLSGLPVVCIDARERQSPMVGWCAEHRIALLPMIFSAGDYMTPSGSVIVDRKDSIQELYHNFSCSSRHASYDIAAASAAAMGKRLLYVIGTVPENHVTCLADLAGWAATIPRVGNVSGLNLYRNIRAYKRLHDNTDFVFIDNKSLCEEIYRQITVEKGEKHDR